MRCAARLSGMRLRVQSREIWSVMGTEGVLSRPLPKVIWQDPWESLLD